MGWAALCEVLEAARWPLKCCVAERVRMRGDIALENKRKTLLNASHKREKPNIAGVL